jgi:hypothetical protein
MYVFETMDTTCKAGVRYSSEVIHPHTQSWLTADIVQGGFCRGAFFLGQFPCCWGSSLLSDDPTCAQWRPWSEGIAGASGAYVVEYFFYVGFSVVFAGFAALLVSVLAPQATSTGVYRLW